MTSPFDDPAGTYLVLTNDVPAGGGANPGGGQLQHCLWPADARVPAGWRRVHGPASRGEALAAVAAATQGRDDPARSAAVPTPG